MNSYYYENLEILFTKKIKGISSLLSTNCRKFSKCIVHYQGNYLLIDMMMDSPNIGEKKTFVFPLKTIQEFRTTFPKVN
jgi:hypothetical protein